jgi:hypothetical protein
MKRQRITDRNPHREIIDLTDSAMNNHTRVVRSRLDSKSEHIGAFDSTGIIVIPEDKGLAYSKPNEPQDPEENYEEKLEAEGAHIIESVTHFPASGITITKKSQTPAEIAEERGYHDFIER